MIFKFIDTIGSFGYKSHTDFAQSVFKVDHNPTLAVVCAVSLTAVDAFLQRWLGLGVYAYSLFVLLLIGDMVTGMMVSKIKRKEKFSSSKFGRGLFRILVYSIALAGTHIAAEKMPMWDFFAENLNIYAIIHQLVLHVTVVWLIISLIENFGRLGWMKSTPLTRILYQRFNKWFDLDNEFEEPTVEGIENTEIEFDETINDQKKEDN